MLDLNLFETGLKETGRMKIEEVSLKEIAVIGMAVRMPMADTPGEFWDIIREGRCCITDFPDSRRTDTEPLIRRMGLYGKSGKYRRSAYLEDIDKFDCRFFRISPNEANLMDPNQRQFLQTAWKAIEDGGYGGGKISGTRTGVYLGYNADAPYTYKNCLSDIDPSLLPIALPGNLTSIIAGRISHILDLRGPSLAVDTACSSSLIAVHLACKALRGGECDMALAGGIKLDLLPLEREFKLGIESSDDRTRTFDDGSDGTAMGEGAAAVLLKPLGRAQRDGDHIYAVISGSAANQDGNTIGITAPSVEAQEEVLVEAWRDAGIDPATVALIEAHGTGTKLGDPIEIEGITRAFGKFTARKQFCAIGSLKTNIGHLDNAAGIAGLVKAVLSLENRELPPSLHFRRPNGNIAFYDSPVYVNDRLSAWPDDGMPRRCGVSAFGLSGTNCHVVLEEAPPKEEKTRRAAPGPQIFTLSARSREAFADMLGKYREWIKDKTAVDLESICYTSNTGRGHYNLRMAVIAENTGELADKLDGFARCGLPADRFESDGIFFGEHNESPAIGDTAGEKQAEAGGDISGGDMDRLVANMTGNSQRSTEMMSILCSGYIRGANINWEELYRNRRIQKLPLPTYSFEKRRCWVKLPEPVVKPENPAGTETCVDGGLVKGIGEAAERKAEKEETKVKLSGRRNGEYSQTEKLVAAAWAETLGLDEIDIGSSFYDLGGDSITAMRVAGLLNENLGGRTEIADVLKHLTIEAFSQNHDERALSAAEAWQADHGIRRAEEREYYPVSSSQRRMYILNQSGGEDLSYNIPAAFLIEGGVDRSRLEDCFHTLVKRHEALRTEFVLKDGEPVQRIAADVPLKMEILPAGTSEIDPVILSFVRPFDVGKAPLLRLGMAELDGGRSLLLLDMHHIVSDGVSAGLLIREFSRLYAGEELPEPSFQYKDFSVWYKEFVESDPVKKQGEYWKNVFSKEIPVLELPYDFVRPVQKAYHGGKMIDAVDGETSKRIEKLARDQKITPNTLFLSLYALLLAGYSGQKAVTVGTIVSGRHHKGIENTVGIFINYLPIFLWIEENCTYAEFFHQTDAVMLEAFQNQDYPYDRLAEELSANPDASRNPLFDTMLVYHNEFQADRVIEADGTVFRKVETGCGSSTLDLKLDIIEMKDGTLEFRFEYNSLLFRQETVRDIAHRFQCLVRSAAEDPGKRMDDSGLFTDEEKQMLARKRNLSGVKPVSAVNLAVAATFTAEPIEEYVKWWCGEFGINACVCFAPYNQVFQELLDPVGLLSSNSGANLLLVRFEDWIRDDRSGEDEKCAKLEKAFSDLLNVVRGKPKQIPYLVALFPVSAYFASGGRVANLLGELTARWRNELSGMQNVYIADLSGLAELYSITEIFDPVKDREGHMPFSDGYYAAMGTEIARKLCTLVKQQFKVVVLDCDNTLWKGVCGEDGALGVSVPEPYAGLQRFMLRKYEEGVLLVLCSKNNEADVWEVFEKNAQMILKKEHFAAWRINWSPKPDNVRELAAELNLGLDSFIFVDDSPMECSGMFHACPEVLTLPLPGHPDAIPSYLAHVWAFDRLKVTEEDRRRNEMYRAEKDRREFRQGMQSISDFIAGLELKLGMDFITEEQIPRVSQLTFRTNQFNLSGRRRTEEELTALLNTEGFRCWTLRSGDRFGDYGMIGALIAKENGDSLDIDTFLLSCRVLGRGVEDAVLAALGEYCRSCGIRLLEADFSPTDKNKPALDFLIKTGWKEAAAVSGQPRFTLPVGRIAAFPPHIGHYHEGGCENHAAAVKETAPYETTAYETVPYKIASYETASDEGIPIFQGSGEIRRHQDRNDWTLTLENEELLLHKCQYAPLLHNTASKLLQLPVSCGPAADMAYADPTPPENETQRRLADIWKELLKREHVGIHDHFFKTGGHSLKAAVLASRIYREFGVDIGLRDIFSNPTIRELAERIESAQISVEPTIRSVERCKSYPVSSVQKRLYILSQWEEVGTGYNITAAFELYGDLDEARLERAFRGLIDRHEALRTSFEARGGEPVQKVSETVDFRLYCADAGQSPVDSLIKAFIRPFDLRRAPLLRAELIHCSRERHVLVIDMHHIISDGTSTAILIGELSALYEGQRLEPLKIHYKDFSAWQSTFFKTERYQRQGRFWKDVFADGVPLLNMPADYPRPAVKRFEGSRLFFGAGTELSEGLGRIAAEEGITGFMLLLAAFNVLLMKYSAQEDIVVGSPVAGRPGPDTEGLIGMFVNTVIIRNKPAGAKSFREFLAEVRENTLLALENQDYQFSDLVEQLDYTRSVNRNPLYDAAFVMLNMDVRTAEAEGIRFAPCLFDTGVSKVDLTLTAVERDSALHFELEYSTSLFRPDTVLRLEKAYLKILETVVWNRNILLRDIELEKQNFAERDHAIDDVDFIF